MKTEIGLLTVDDHMNGKGPLVHASQKSENDKLENIVNSLSAPWVFF